MNKTFLLIIILFAALFLRFHNYSVYPQRGATSDEYTYAFLGLSLMENGIPTSWSYFGEYTDRQDMNIDGTLFPMVTPYFDHPPLAGLIIGGWSRIRGEETFAKVKLSTIRIIPILFSMVSAVLLYMLAKNLYGSRVGLWSLAIYSVSPLFAVSHRVAVSENILTTFFLAALTIYSGWKKRVSTPLMVQLGILSGLGFWTKETGVVIFLSIFFLLFIQGERFKMIAQFTLVFLLFILAYIAYGYAYDGQLFWKIIGLQSAREIGPASLWYLISTPIIINKVYHDGWYYFGLLSIFVLAWEKKHAAVFIPFLTYFTFLIISLTKEGQSGWYLIPLFPFLAIAAGYTLATSIEQRSLYFLIFVLFIGLFLVQQLFIPAFGLVPFQFRFLVGILIVLAVALRRLQSVWAVALIVGTAVVTLLYVHPA